ncbi:uncharacterized protein iftap isoform X3 [Brachyhypopomus gauderio]|uniref:uncharacterized protein iftap isoform X3 n=1 Tax=Brachyhypopomus gauderio TaxID=698409 RepID=UPI0040421E0C
MMAGHGGSLLFNVTVLRGMARLQNNPGYVPYDQTITEALELFCNVPEQSYEQFMSTFTHLTPDNVMGACLNVLREHHTTSHGEMGRPNRNIMDSGVDAVYKRGSSPRGQGNTLSTDLEELEQDGRVPAGRLSHRATFPSHPPGKIPDNCVDDTQDKEEPLHSTEGCFNRSKLSVCFLERLKRICRPVLRLSVIIHCWICPLRAWTTGHTLH